MGDALELLKKIKEAQEDAAVELDGWDYRTRPAMEAAKRAAVEALDKLTKEYRAYVQEHGAVIIVQGPAERQKEFAEIAAVEGDTMTVDGSKLYRDLAAVAANTMGTSRTFSSNQIVAVGKKLRDVALEVGIGDYTRPNYARALTSEITSQEYLVEVIREGIRTSLADDFNRVVIERAAADTALAEKRELALLPIVVTGLTADEAESLVKSLFGGRATVVTLADKNVEANDVVKAFTQLKQAIKKTN